MSGVSGCIVKSSAVKMLAPCNLTLFPRQLDHFVAENEHHFISNSLIYFQFRYIVISQLLVALCFVRKLVYEGKSHEVKKTFPTTVRNLAYEKILLKN